MYVIGTAGHVDHGKSTLVKALTGIHPDRLKEEIDREMTIDLGFAWFSLPSGDLVGIVDMPGHRDFIENMLSGVGGIDAVLLVIAADEGVMPQTREHLAIIDLLQVKKGIIVLTKIDMVKDPDWLDLVKEDVNKLVKGTVLETAPVLSVSSASGMGIEELKKTLSDLLQEAAPRIDVGKPRLPIDRAFTMTGFGTIVTGTLLDGELEVGQEIVILPAGKAARIRGLQSYKTKLTRVGPGNRVAVNLSGINVDDIKRGDVLSLPGTYVPTNVVYAHVRILNDASSPARSNSEIKIFLGSAEILARLKIIGARELKPGEEGWVRLESGGPMVAVKKDRFILRRPSPAETIGGGEVVEDHPGKAFESHKKTIIENLKIAYEGRPEEILSQVLIHKDFLTLVDLRNESLLSADEVLHAVKHLILEGKVQILQGDEKHLSDSTIIIHSDNLTRLMGKVSEELRNFHEKNPLKRGMLKEEVRSRLNLNARFFQAIVLKMSSGGKLVEDAAYLRMPDFKIRYTPEQNNRIKKLQDLFDKTPFTPPTIGECIEIVGEEIFNVLIDNEVYLRLNQDVVFDPQNLEKLHLIVSKYLEDHPSLSVAEFRDLVKTSRKFALAVLEYFDEKGITVRKGDSRVLVNKPPLTD